MLKLEYNKYERRKCCEMDTGNPDRINFDKLKTKLLETKSLFTLLSILYCRPIKIIMNGDLLPVGEKQLENN